jgi:hypothetical protein
MGQLLFITYKLFVSTVSTKVENTVFPFVLACKNDAPALYADSRVQSAICCRLPLQLQELLLLHKRQELSFISPSRCRVQLCSALTLKALLLVMLLMLVFNNRCSFVALQWRKHARNAMTRFTATDVCVAAVPAVSHHTSELMLSVKVPLSLLFEVRRL